MTNAAQTTPAGDAREPLVHQLRAILPAPHAGARIALAVGQGGGMRSEFFTTAEQAAGRALELDGAGATVYLSTGVFAAGTGGAWIKRDRAHLAPLGRKSLHLDIDIGPGKDYASLHEAVTALGGWTMATGLRRGQTLVSSGRGLHVYWTLAAPIELARWDELAHMLADLAEAMGLRVDTHCTRDAVRLLRPVGTTNRKDGRALPVATVASELLRADGRPWPTVLADDLATALRTALDACAPAPTSEPFGAVAALGAGTCAQASNADLMAFPPRPETPEHVGWVQRRLEAVPADCGYAEWRDVVWSVASTGWQCARDLAQTWSAAGKAFDDGAFDKLWASYSAAAGGPTLGTLDHVARAHGFVEQTAPAPTDDTCNPGVLPAGTEAWHAREFAASVAGRLAFVHGSGRWVRWDGQRWEWCSGGEEMREAMGYVAGLLHNAQAAERMHGPADPRAVVLHKDAVRMSNRKPMANMLDLARADRRLAIKDAAAFDADPWSLGVANGVVDLKAGNLLAADPRMMISRQCGASFDRDATCPQWERFLLEVFNGDVETVGYVQRLMGYCLTGDVTAELLHFAYGHGANGKSVFANVIAHVMGSYVYHAQLGLLVHDSRDTGKGPNPDVARMSGARIVYVNETEQGARLSETTVKALVSTEPVTVRELYGSPFTFKPTAKLLVRGNHRPVVTGTDDGVWRRLRLLPFTRQFTGDQRDDGLALRLIAEADGILQWMLAGLAQWKQRGLTPARAIAAGSADYRQSMDIVGQWLDDRCTLDPQEATPTGEAFMSYRFHCESSGLRVTSQNALTRELERRRIEVAQRTIAGRRTRVYVGLRINRDALPPPAG